MRQEYGLEIKVQREGLKADQNELPETVTGDGVRYWDTKAKIENNGKIFKFQR